MNTINYRSIAIFIIPLLTGAVSTYFIRVWARNRAWDDFDNVQMFEKIADFRILGGTDLADRLRARAIPNQRLVTTFDIHSSFTTMDEAVHRHFLGESISVIHEMRPPRWFTFSTVADEALNQVLTHFEYPQRPLPLAKMARPFAFITMLYPLFGVMPANVNLDDAIQVSEEINYIWVESKREPIPDLRENKERLQDALRRLLPDKYPCTAEENPINIIMPAYETMWRVVLHTFLAAGFREVDQETEQQFREVIENVPECLTSNSLNDAGIMAINFAKEGLRLYPPTQRINRAIPPQQPNQQPTQVSANIQEAHRYTSIWGADVLSFRPSRFGPEKPPSAYMPFGAGRHRCPSAKDFAYKAIIIQVVALVRRLGIRDGGAKVRFNDPVLDNDGRALMPMGRMDMEGWTMEVGRGD
ncbi:cytochrome P450 [Hypoxylon trugodes]|uniref:cytochrome P450 n=1 Tax=Hypoxylon trugodes TaxID=326681 RepID=UPI002195C1FC|nr:cytochrome P450 [Hypoxylon trugodes]KAI1384268.1 cytochrome P450 [Hypoxylon trugodes]